MKELAPTSERRFNPSELLPSPEDWVALQGGKPRVFRNPTRPHTRWIVLHVYDEHVDREKRFQSGIIVDTLPERVGDMSVFTVPERIAPGDKDEGEGDIVIPAHDIAVPSFMVRSLHGNECEIRSGRAGGDRYPRVKNQADYERLLIEFESQGLEELRLGIGTDHRLQLQAMHTIRPARPLAA